MLRRLRPGGAGEDEGRSWGGTSALGAAETRQGWGGSCKPEEPRAGLGRTERAGAAGSGLARVRDAGPWEGAWCRPRGGF